MEEENTKKSEAALREERILEFWRENKIFEQSLSQSEGKKEFIFYEGPPTANGKPGIHHLEARAFKDAIPRYKTMRGYHVRRKGGWDTHGLAVEIQEEKKLGLNSKKAIEEYGIAKFNQACKESVWEYLEVWNKFTKRIGFWVDQENPYVTYHNDYIESVWNVVKKINEQNLFYKDYKVVPWCPRCGTALSSHELAQGYEDVKDLSVYVKFRVSGGNTALSGSLSPSADGALPLGSSACERPLDSNISTFILAWTTTPWTLPGNVALAVGKDINYVKVKTGNEIYILAKERLPILTEPYEIIEEIKSNDLIGLEYEPLYPYLANTISEGEKSKLGKAFKVYKANFVTTGDGTGIVHTAVMYGQDDFELGTEIGLPKHHLVGLDGKFLPGTGPFEGRFVKDEEVAIDIIKDLAHRGLLLKKEKYEHSYPHCWRCHTALIYYARDSWYIKMSDPKIKQQLISENEKINWEPAHIRDGRFGEWLREIKDWAVSRERYWGTPLPVWICEACKKVDVLGSIEDLKAKTKKSGNQYFVARHGEAISNVKMVIDSRGDKNNKLTEKGTQDVKNNIEKHKNVNFDFIFSSPMSRAKETASIIADTFGFDKNQIIFDERLLEFQVGDLDGKNIEEYFKYIKTVPDYLSTPLPKGESRLSVYKRMGDFLYELEKKYENKKILIISHGDPILALFLSARGYTKEKIREEEKDFEYFKTGEIRKLPFISLPHNENYELDLHRPYIDEINLVCECGGKLTRTKEVMDVWFDSGAMPFAQDHYPFSVKKILYPADYICEAIDQTRGWFYTLHAVGILMGRGKAYKNVICLGHLLDANGKKMSKSIGNVVDPWEAMDKYGVDTLRLWMYSVNQPGESKNFDEKTVALLYQQVFGLLYNVLAFYELYRDKTLEKNDRPEKRPESKNILDVWILARLDELIDFTTKHLDDYKLLEPVRAMKDFIGDLSTWYLRRSRERIKNGDKDAKETLYYVLKTLAKIMAPFAPFAAEDIWLKLKNDPAKDGASNDVESVHLENWPAAPFKLFSIIPLPNLPLYRGRRKEGVLENMQTIRNIVTLGLEARQKAGIKVRQPLNQLRIKNYELGIEYAELIRDELNVKEIVQDKNLETEVELDVNITPELKQEGDYRELARALQDMRKKMGLTPSDVVSITFETNDAGKKLIQKFEADMKKTVLVSKIEFKNNDGEEVKIDDLDFKVKIDKM
jgi:isoleucyl-tRNA synthetase